MCISDKGLDISEDSEEQGKGRGERADTDPATTGQTNFDKISSAALKA